jgi:hypothetical protein
MKTLILAAIRCSLMFLVPTVTYAASAQWDLDPISSDWNTAANWTPMTVPNGPADTATFALSNTTSVSISANTRVEGITFTPAATNSYTITAGPFLTPTLLQISGTGITNNSGTTQNFVTASDGVHAGGIIFSNSASAGSSTLFTNNSGGVAVGFTEFFDTSTAGSGIFTNNGGTVALTIGGFMEFRDASTAASGIFTNNGGTVAGAGGAFMNFVDTSTAATGTFTNNGGAPLVCQVSDHASLTRPPPLPTIRLMNNQSSSRFRIALRSIAPVSSADASAAIGCSAIGMSDGEVQ